MIGVDSSDKQFCLYKQWIFISFFLNLMSFSFLFFKQFLNLMSLLVNFE